MLTKWLLSAAAVLAIFFCSYLVSGFKGSVSVADLNALSGIVEVSIGICAAYVGLDRFRLHNRCKTVADRISRKNAQGKDILLSSRSDGKLNQDEMSVLAVYDLIGDESVKKFCGQHPAALQDNDFEKTVIGFVLKVLLRWRFERSLVISALVALCGIEMLSSIFQLEISRVFDWLPEAKVVTAILCTASVGLLVPALSYLLSEWAFNGLERFLERRFTSIATTMSRNAVAAVLPSAPAAAPAEAS